MIHYSLRRSQNGTYTPVGDTIAADFISGAVMLIVARIQMKNGRTGKKWMPRLTREPEHEF
jgi:hypothetical protein